jgi:hypothetical protein
LIPKAPSRISPDSESSVNISLDSTHRQEIGHAPVSLCHNSGMSKEDGLKAIKFNGFQKDYPLATNNTDL